MIHLSWVSRFLLESQNLGTMRGQQFSSLIAPPTPENISHISKIHSYISPSRLHNVLGEKTSYIPDFLPNHRRPSVFWLLEYVKKEA